MLTDEESKEFWKMMKRIGRNIRSVRRERKLTQEEVSQLIGFSYKHFQSVENGDRPLSTRSLFKISKRFNVSIKKLVS